ncbi:hypothetical protein ACL03H_18955 [Saccharopolyspora sp. MS10]|uniref:hypothetical protein n=1 Tax=Saccharopolyspora sp. MS10 TaxID=3385973 RepID=UPI0039A355CF
MSQPHGPPPGQPHPQPGAPAPQGPASGPFAQPHPASGPFPQPHPWQPNPGSGSFPQQPPSSGAHPVSGPLPQQSHPYPGGQPHPGQQPPPGPPAPPGSAPWPQQFAPPGHPHPGQPHQALPPGMPRALPGPPPAGMGRIVLNASYPALAFTLGLFKPGVTINGQPGPPASWGATVIDLPPGQHRVEVHVNYLWKFGSATAVIPVQPGRQLEAYYKPPMQTFGSGAIGPVPQSTPNVGLTVALCVLAAVLGLLIGMLPQLL